jgi:hypothetical protein
MKEKRNSNPFNMSSVEYEKMFESSTPDSLVMIVSFYATDGHSAKQQSEMRKVIGEYLTENSEDSFIKRLMGHPQTGEKIGIEMFVEHVIGSDFEKSTSHTDDVVIPFQVSFCEGSLFEKKLQLKTALAMNRYDFLVHENKSIDPKKQISYPISKEMATFDNNVIGDCYKSGTGIWRRELVEKRNMCSITISALMMEFDPETEWNHFVNTDGEYFTGYPI